MFFTLPNTTTKEIVSQLVSIRETGVQVTTGRVLTLIIVANADDDIDSLIKATNAASREHPSRVLLMVADKTTDESRLDAEISIGGDIGASEMIKIKLSGEVAGHIEAVITPLLLPDTPIVAWWPSVAPINPAEDPIGKIAQRRITDALSDPTKDSIYQRRNNYTPGDSDMTWARITQLRGMIASALDQPPHEEITEVKVYGPTLNPSVDLTAGWLADRLGVNVIREDLDTITIPIDSHGEECIEVTRIDLVRGSSTITFEVRDAQTVSMKIPGKNDALVALSRRSQSDCLAEELRHLDPDRTYARALRGLSRVHKVNATTQ